MFYFSFLKRLAKADIKYVIVGGLAVNFHGIPRFTADIDIVLAMDPNNLKKFVQLIKKIKFSIRQPIKMEEIFEEGKLEEWRKTKNLLAISFFNSQAMHEHVDVLIETPVLFKDLFKKAKKIEVEKDVIVPIASVDHLIKMKKKAKREQDLSDIKYLKMLEDGKI